VLEIEDEVKIRLVDDESLLCTADRCSFGSGRSALLEAGGFAQRYAMAFLRVTGWPTLPPSGAVCPWISRRGYHLRSCRPTLS
jgi:hypothetical protein